MLRPRDRLRNASRAFAAVRRNRDLRNAQLAFLGFNAVEYGTWIAILLYAYEATGPASVGVVALVQLAPAAIFAPVAASLGERMPRRRFLIVAYTVATATTGLVAVVMSLHAEPAIIYAFACIDAAAYTMTRPAHAAALPILADRPEELTAANGLSSIFEGAGVVAGPIGAAAILTVASPAAVFLVGALLLVMASGLVATIRGGASVQAPADDAPEVESSFEGFRLLAREREPRLIVGLLSARMIVIGALDVLFVLMALELFDAGESGAGVLNAALGVGGMIGGAVTLGLVGRRRLGPAVVLGALVFGVSFAVVGLLSSRLGALALIVAGAIGLSLMDATGRTLLQRVVPDETLARVFGVLEGLAMGALGFGSILVSAVDARIGLRGTIVAIGAFLPVLSVLSIPGVRRIDARTVVPEREIALLTRVPMFAPLRPPVIESLARRSSWVSVPTRVPLISEGEPGDRYYVLASGRLDVTVKREHVRTISEPGEGVGEIALLYNLPRTATVVATEPSELLSLERADFLTAVTGHPDVARAAEQIADIRMSAGG